MPRPPRQEVSGKPMRGPPVTDDPRFASVHSDPRFSLSRRKDAKVQIDKRFKRMLVDEDFFHTTKVDRYGRRLATDSGKREIKRYYQLGDSEGESLDEEESGKQLGYDPARGEGIIDTSGESETDDGTEVEGEGEEVETGVREVIPTGDVYRRIAVVNLDWDNVHSVDLLVILSSFKPADGNVLSVRIYPSEFGKSRLKREDMGGPPREIFTAQEGEEESDEEVTEKTLIRADDGEEFDSTKLRNYQLERLRYYYAVVECDSENTAKHIYDNCDGTEYEASANFLDLRFIPDNVEFEDSPKDECLRIPDNYKPNEFVTDALQHSKVKLTWDQDDPARRNKAKKAFSQKEIEEMDLKEYLASSDSEEEDAEELKKKYRALLSLGGKICGKEKEVAGDMEITFTSGLMGDQGDEGQELLHEETTIEKYVRKEKERMKSRKEAYLTKKDLHTNGTAGQDRDESQGGLGFDDPFFKDQAPVKQERKRQSKEERKREETEKAAQRAELELLMVEDEDVQSGKLKHFNMKEVIKAEKAKKFKKRKRSKNTEDTEGVQEGFEVDVNDPRFVALYEEHDFAIDPTNPRFKQTNTMMKLMEEKRNRSKNNIDNNEGEQAGRKKLKAVPRSSKQLIQSLKRGK